MGTAQKLPNRILVIQTAFLGDIVLTTPFLANLRELAPRAEIRFLTTPVGASILDPNPFGVTVVSYDKRGKDRGPRGFLRLGKQLRSWRPDLVFCLHRSLRSALLAKTCGGEIYGFREAAGSPLFDHRVARPENVFEAEKNQKVLEAWAGERAARQTVFPKLSVTKENEEEAEALLVSLGGQPFVAFAPGSVWATKRWPAEKFGALAGMLWEKKGLRAVIVGGKDASDLDCAARLTQAVPAGTPKPLDLAGKTGLGAMKSVLSRAKLVVANDSAPLHVAIAMGAPVVGVFGPTTRALGFFPNAPEGRAGVAELGGLECRPCGMHGHDRCPLGHFRCMLELAPGAVFREAEKFL